MPRFRKKPVEIEARQWTGENFDDLKTWLGDELPLARPIGGGIMIATLEGRMTADRGDWIVRGIKGEFYPCKPDIFAATYDEVKTPVPTGLPGPGEGPA